MSNYVVKITLEDDQVIISKHNDVPHKAAAIRKGMLLLPSEFVDNFDNISCVDTDRQYVYPHDADHTVHEI